MLVFCGRPTEAVLGPFGLAILYLLGAYAAAGAQYAVDPAEVAPMIGASGAISAVLGAYAMLFGRNKVKVANPTLALWLNALWLMAAWVGLNVVIGHRHREHGRRSSPSPPISAASSSALRWPIRCCCSGTGRPDALR